VADWQREARGLGRCRRVAVFLHLVWGSCRSVLPRPRIPARLAFHSGKTPSLDSRDRNVGLHPPGRPFDDSDQSDDEDEECIEIGVLYCCGRRLIWRELDGREVMETSCEECGTKFAMALKDDGKQEETWRDETVWRDAV
jgi:hypothetical protein